MKILKSVLKPLSSLAGKIDHSVEQKIAMSVVRHIATAMGALLLSHGVIVESQMSDVVGALVVLLGIVSGAVQKLNEDPAKS